MENCFSLPSPPAAADPETVNLLMKLPMKDLSIPLNAKTWSSNRRVPGYIPQWSQLVGAKLWVKEEYEHVRACLRRSLVRAQAVDPGAGIEACVVHLKQGEEVQKELGFGSFEALCKWVLPNAVFIELGEEQDVTEPMFNWLTETRLPFVIFGGYDNVRNTVLPKFHLVGRDDTTLVQVTQGWSAEPELTPGTGNRLDFAEKPNWYRCPTKLAVLGGWPLRQERIFPYIYNYDMTSPPNCYPEYDYLLDIMAPPVEVSVLGGNQSRILLIPHERRTVLETLVLAATICGNQDHWVVSAVVNGDPPDDYEAEVSKAYELAITNRDRMAWCTDCFMRGEPVTGRGYRQFNEEQTKDTESKKRKELKQEAALMAQVPASFKATAGMTAPRAERKSKKLPEAQAEETDADEQEDEDPEPDVIEEIGGPEDGQHELWERRQALRVQAQRRQSTELGVLASGWAAPAEAGSSRIKRAPERFEPEQPATSSRPSKGGSRKRPATQAPGSPKRKRPSQH